MKHLELLQLFDSSIKFSNVIKQWQLLIILLLPQEMTGRQSKLFQHLLKQGYSQEFTVKVTNLVQNKAKKNFDTLPIEQVVLLITCI